MDNTWLIEKFSQFQNKWITTQRQKMFLKLQFDQGFVFCHDTLLEAFNLTNMFKALVKEKTLIIIYIKNSKVHKIKMLFAHINDIQSAINELNKHCHVQNCDAPILHAKNISFQEALSEEMQRQNRCYGENLFPDNFDFEQFLKICILDPNFPDIVDAIGNAIEEFPSTSKN